MIERVIERTIQASHDLGLRPRAAAVRLVGPRVVGSVAAVVAVPFRKRLGALARIHGSDKAGRHDYARNYERHLIPLRHRPVTVIEIGIGGYDDANIGGGSLRMWQAWFRRGQIHGVDLYEKRVTGRRITTHQADQSDFDTIAELGRRLGPFDVIIDDGSHINQHITTTFAALWPALAPGGWYIVEDMATAYSDDYGGGPIGTSGTSVDLVKGLVDRVNARASGAVPGIAELHIYEEISFIRRST